MRLHSTFLNSGEARVCSSQNFSIRAINYGCNNRLRRGARPLDPHSADSSPKESLRLLSCPVFNALRLTLRMRDVALNVPTQ